MMFGQSPRQLRIDREIARDELQLSDETLLIVGRHDEDGRAYAITLGELKAWLAGDKP
jgi:hypothetical protein